MNRQMDALVSIIIVNYNGKKWLKNCLDSVLKQTYKNFEVIVVDNASTDGSIEFIEKKYPPVRLVKLKKNIGFAGGNNIGIEHAKGGLIILLNNDTWLENNFLEKLVKFYVNNDYDVVGPKECSYYKPYSKQNFYWSIDFTGHPIPKKTIDKMFYLSGVCVLFSKKLYLETGSLDNNFFMYFEEIDWFWRLNLLGKRFTYVPSLYIHHRSFQLPKGQLRLNYERFLWRNQNELQMLLKNYSLLMLTIVLPLYFLQNIFEIVFFLIILKPKIAFSYVEGWLFNIKNIKKTFTKRKKIQTQRKVSDIYILSKMSLIPGKLVHLWNYVTR